MCAVWWYEASANWKLLATACTNHLLTPFLSSVFLLHEPVERASSSALLPLTTLASQQAHDVIIVFDQKVNPYNCKKKLSHPTLTPELCHLFKTTFRCQDLLKFVCEPTSYCSSSSVEVAWFGAGTYRAALKNRSNFHPDHQLGSVKVLIGHIYSSLRNQNCHSDVTILWLYIAVAQTLNNIYRSIYISAPVTCQQLQYSRWGPRIKETTSITASGSGGVPCDIRTPAEHREDPGAFQTPPAPQWFEHR